MNESVEMRQPITGLKASETELPRGHIPEDVTPTVLNTGEGQS